MTVHYSFARPTYNRTDWCCEAGDEAQHITNVPIQAEQHQNWIYCPICGGEV